MSNNVCIAGQLYLIELTSILEEHSEILQVNTDGIYMRVKDMATVEKLKELAKEWETRLNLDLEWDLYEKGVLVQKDVNNYILFDEDKVKNGDTKHIVRKGAYVKQLSPIDYDLPVINKALVNYFMYGVPVETTINNEDNLIEFQKVIRLTNLYKGVVYGDGVKRPVKIGNKMVDRVMVDNGIPLKEKVHRIFASTRESDKGIFKVKVEKGQESYENIAYTPDRCFIYNESLEVDWYYDEDERVHKHNGSIKAPEYLDKKYYIDLANERIRQYLTKEEVKINNNPTILYDNMMKSNNFVDFLTNCKDAKITNRILKDYITADCCSIYGKTKKLLEFLEYFNYLYGKERITITNINKKIVGTTKVEGLPLLEEVKTFGELNKTGKTLLEFNSNGAMLKIFNLIENVEINPIEIMMMQLKLFTEIRYTDDTMDDNVYFVLNTRNVIAPNVNLYRIKDGVIEYRKVAKKPYNVLPMQDGDVIKVSSTQQTHGLTIVGKDDMGKNILEEDDRVYDVIASYDIIYRNYGLNSTLVADKEVMD